MESIRYLFHYHFLLGYVQITSIKSSFYVYRDPNNIHERLRQYIVRLKNVHQTLSGHLWYVVWTLNILVRRPMDVQRMLCERRLYAIFYA